MSATSPAVHAEGLTEKLGDITLTCTGGSGTVNSFLFVGVNANVTNRLDSSGNLTGITVTGAGVTFSAPTLYSPTAIFFSSLQFPGSAIITISGIRVAVPSSTGGSTIPTITGTLAANLLNLPGSPLVLGIAAPTLLASSLNYGIPCLGSPLPATVNFPNLISAGTSVSTVRITEASAAAFAPKSATSDYGVRFIVKISGYGANAQVYVPDVIVGNRGFTPTAAGAYNSTPAGGTYQLGLNQLLLSRVNGADANGAGGTLVLPSIPAQGTSFTSVSQLTLANGAASAVYEVLDANPSLIDLAQIPVFVSVPATSCSNAPLANTLGVTLAPTSTVSVPSQTDPIPRFVAATPASDCTANGDCTASYFPVLQVSPASITLSSSSLGQPQTSFITVNDGGSSQLTFTAATTYQPAANQSTANWLSVNGTTATTISGVVDPAIGINSFGLSLSASPAALLIPGTYQATVTINAGSAGTTAVPVTFNVGPAGPVIQSVVNAANAQPGAITAGSFASIYGLNLVPKNNATVTFSGLSATIVYDGQPTPTGPTQINVLVPAGLGSSAAAGVVATIDGVASNSFPVNLTANAPAVFTPGILNQNNSVNLASAPASRGDIVQVFLTGLATPVTVPVTVNIGSQSVTGSQIFYAGAVASIPGLEQVNVQVPSTLTLSGNSAPLSICVPGASGLPACSAPVNLYLQ